MTPLHRDANVALGRPVLIRRIDRYELIEEVGTGGMAVVYRGRDTALDREVAVKLLHPHLAARAESRARFSREARAVARLKHPNIVEIYDYAGDAAVESYLVTEFVHGRTLRVFADEERLDDPEVAALLVRALADALAHAHAAGVIHRDLKPENILVLESGGSRSVKLVDFGIARLLASDERMTMTGALVGSPNHMAPEIIEGRDADARSDVFSLGTILYWLATGQLPFAAPNPTATLRRVIEGAYVDPRRASPRISEELASAIDQALASDPQRRTPTAARLRDDLDAALAASGITDADAELREFLSSPGAYRSALRPRVVASVLERADAALAAGELPAGMKLLDRVLALDPGNEIVAARLARITARVRWRQRARMVGLAAIPVLLLGLALSAVAPWFRPSAPAHVAEPPASGRAPSSTRAPIATARPPATPPPSSTLEAPGAAPGGSSVAGPTATAGTGVPEPRSPVAPSPSRAARSVSVQIHVRPYAQRALLDGVEVARGEQRIAFTFSTGSPHRIQVEHACCFPFVRDFAAGEIIPQPFELKIPLRPRPARLRVDADPATRIYVDGKLAGTAGDSQRAPLEIPVPAGGETPYEAPAQLLLERDGAAPFTTTLRIRAGADLAFAAAPVSLVPAADAAAASTRPVETP